MDSKCESVAGRVLQQCHLHAWETGSETKAAIRKWMTFYKHQRPHSALDGKLPALVYWQKNDINQTDQQVQRVA
jgi:putative transposase